MTFRKSPLVSLPLPHSLLLVFLALLPFQERWFSWLKSLSKVSFRHEILPAHLIDACCDYYIGEILLVGALTISIFYLRKKIFSLFSSGPWKYIALFLFFTTISLCMSERKDVVWPYCRLCALILPFISLPLLCQKTDLPSLMPLLFAALFWGSCIESIIAIFQYMLQSELGLKHLGELHIHFNHSASIFVPSQRRWLFDLWLHTKSLSPLLLRPYGTLPHPNILGAYLGVGILSTCYFFGIQKTQWRRLGLYCALGIQSFALLLTFSRGALFALLVASFLLFWLQKPKRLFVASLYTMLFLGGIVLSEQLLHRGGVINYTELAKQSDLPRLAYQSQALAIAKKSPWFGCGWSQFLVAAHKLPPIDHLQQKAHSVYFLLLAETGVLALLSYLAFFISLLYRARTLLYDPSQSILVAMLLLCLLFSLVDHFFVTMHHGRSLLITIASLLGTYMVQKTSQIRSMSHKEDSLWASPG